MLDHKLHLKSLIYFAFCYDLLPFLIRMYLYHIRRFPITWKITKLFNCKKNDL